MIAGFLFYMFAIVLLLSATLVVTVRQPVSSVLLLILAFFNAAGLFLLLGAEFLSFILLIVYVGAVAVLFLFVVMMLDVKGAPSRVALRRHLPLALAVAGVLSVQLLLAVWSWPSGGALTPLLQQTAPDVENTKALGHILYTTFAMPFQTVGVILLVAMIGAITLTHRPPRHIKKQRVGDQLDRCREDVLEIVKIESGKGVGL